LFCPRGVSWWSCGPCTRCSVASWRDPAAVWAAAPPRTRRGHGAPLGPVPRAAIAPPPSRFAVEAARHPQHARQVPGWCGPPPAVPPGAAASYRGQKPPPNEGKLVRISRFFLRLFRQQQPAAALPEDTWNHLLQVGVAGSVQQGIIPTDRPVDLAEDTSDLRSGGNTLGHRTCPDRNCSCPRTYSDPGARTGWDSSANCRHQNVGNRRRAPPSPNVVATVTAIRGRRGGFGSLAQGRTDFGRPVLVHVVCAARVHHRPMTADVRVAPAAAPPAIAPSPGRKQPMRPCPSRSPCRLCAAAGRRTPCAP